MQTLRLVEALVSGGHECVTVCYFEYDYPIKQMFELAGSQVVCLSAYGRRPEGRHKTYKFLKEGLKRVVNEYQPEIAHVQYMAPGAMPIIILSKLGIKKIIATLHTNADIYKNLHLIHFLQRHKTVAFTCVTEIAERGFFGSSTLFDRNFTLHKRNHFTVHNCLPPLFNIQETDSEFTPNSPLTIGVVARLEEIKGADYVMPAFAKVLESLPECRLIIVGDGTLREQMEQQQQDYKIADSKVTWTGKIPYNKLSEQYGKMDVVWVPSRSEGFGLSAIEAMANGRTVIASDTGGLMEVINDGSDGLLFKNGDIDDLASKTASILSDIPRLLQLSQNAKNNASKYTFDHYRDTILNLYSKLTTN